MYSEHYTCTCNIVYGVCVCLCVCVWSIQDWLSASARKVSLAHRPMEWVTPLGLPVVQPYHKMYHKSVGYCMCIPV